VRALAMPGVDRLPYELRLQLQRPVRFERRI
jgi:hypothetical protein